MKSLTDIYTDAKSVILGYLGSTRSSRRDYVQRFYSQTETDTGKDCFERGLDVACAFRAAKIYGNVEYFKGAISKLESLEKNLSDGDSLSTATKVWINTEAYQATGSETYLRKSKHYADTLVDELMDVGRFVKSDRNRLESCAETQLVSACALLQMYELSKVEKYKRRAEDILDFFIDNHVSESGGLAEKINVSVEDGVIRYARKGSGDDKLSNLAAITYMNAYRVIGKYSNAARRFFDASDGSLMVLSEANRSFKTKEYSGKYNESLKQRLVAQSFSARDLSGVLGKPAFDIDPEDPSLFRDMLGVNFAIAFGTSLVWTAVVSFGAPVYAFSTAAICATGAVVSPYIGKLADRIGKKTMLALGMGAYTLSTLMMPWSITQIGNTGLVLLQTVRGVSGIVAGPLISSLVTDTVPESRKTEALSQSTSAYSAGYTTGSLFGGLATEYISKGSELVKFSPFLIAAFPPAMMIAKVLANYKETRLKRQMLDSIFKDVDVLQ